MRLIVFAFLLSWSSLVYGTDYFVGGAGASDANGGTAAQPFATIQKAASVAKSGDFVKIRAGVYRETVTPATSGVTFQPDNGAIVIVSGLNDAGNDGWTVHSGNIYKKSITLPAAENFNEYNNDNNTTLLANQVFKDGDMMHLARWPKVSTVQDLFDRTKFRYVSNTQGWGDTNLTDPGIGSLGIANLTGAWISMSGWFVNQTRKITGHSGNTINYSTVISVNGPKFRKFYYITNHLGLLTQAREWHYQGGVLYLWQPGGGSPTGVEYKARNYGFDLKGKSNTTIQGLQFMGCDAVNTNSSSPNTVVDNIRAKFSNHCFITMAIGESGNCGNAIQSGLKLMGANSTVKNSEFRTAGTMGVWLNQGCRAENNYFEAITYDGMWGAPIRPWNNSDNQVITRNTSVLSGRGAVEISGDHESHNKNMEISYNDFYGHNALSIDGGAIYSQLWSAHDGSRIHHNWFHDAKVYAEGGIDLEGIQITGVYLDQAAGAGNGGTLTIDHNVHWNGPETDFYQQTEFEGRDGGLTRLLNNTFGSQRHMSYESYAAPVKANEQKNNIYARGNYSPNKALDIVSSLLSAVNPMFVGSGGAGLNYRIQAGSPARDAGMVIGGITDGSVGNPDVGAYEYGAPDWTAGYKAVAVTPTNAAPVVGLTAPANNTSVAQGVAINITANATDADGSITRVEFFDGATKIGEDLTSPYAFSWPNATVGSHTITARATDNLNAGSTSAAITVTVTGIANTNPTVSITAPANNTSVAQGVAINITATAADANGTVAKVEFFDGAAKLGEDTSNPYSFNWTNAAVGAHAISAKATDNQGGVTTSVVVNLTVTATPTPPAPTPPAPTPPTPNTNPVVSITSPSNSASFNSGVSIDIIATASDANGTVSKVEFFDGASKLGEDLTTPYSFTWTNAGVGSHSLTAKATDNLNATTTSAAVSVTVEAAIIPSEPPVVSAGSDVSLLLPDNAATLNGTATSSSPNLSYSWNQLAGPTTATMANSDAAAVSVSGLTEGTYVFEVTMTDENGQASKDQVSVIVSAQAAIGQTTIPRFFTPNADGQNDTWVLPDSFISTPTQVTVFNSLGQKVFEEATYTTAWDGKSNGQQLQDDAYYYVIKRQTGSVLQGAVRIMR